MTNICIESLPTVSMEESVHDAVDPTHDSARNDPPLAEAIKVLAEDYVSRHPTSLVYHDCLKQFAKYLVPPVLNTEKKN